MTTIKSIRNFCLVLIFAYSCLSVGYSQIYINEFLASNANVIENSDFNEYSDWFELYNAGNAPVNLRGYYLTDNYSNPDKWRITEDVVLAPDSHLLIWADGNDSGLHTSFKLSQDGEEICIFSPSMILIDSISYSQQYTDISYGRKYDGSLDWGYFTEPTPGSENNTTAYDGIVHSLTDFSINGGFYDSPIQLELSTYLEGVIRYTTDGSIPIESSPQYTSPIQINTTTIIRARIFNAYHIPGKTVTHSYFLNNESETGGLPVISIATDPDNFWDPSTGIYVQNFKPEWEVPINIEMFENNGSDRAAFNELAGTKVNGLYSWRLPQKMLGIYFRKQYDENKLEYPLLFDQERSSYKSFALRASGSDWSYTLFRDGVGHHATQLNMNIDIQGFRPCVVYVNGEYLGIHNIRSKIDDDYIEKTHGLEPGSFDMIEYEEYVEAGNMLEYKHLKDLLSKDLSVQLNYDAVADAMDIENFTDFMITEICVANSSIDHNVMAWKPKNEGKWKWILMDLDRGFFNPAEHLLNFYTGRDVVPLNELLDNPGYKDYFGRRLADHLYTTFHPLSMQKEIDKHQQLIEAEIPKHIERWEGTTSSYGDAIPSVEYWHNEICDMKNFVIERPQVLLDNLSTLGFNGTHNLSLSIFPSNGGNININDLSVPQSDWSGPYLSDVQVHLHAEEKPGYEFQGWSLSTEQIIISRGANWKYLDNGSDQGTAWKEVDFNDDSWSEGPAELGYGDGDETTEISFGGNSNNKYISSYFRHTFQLTADQLAVTSYGIKLLLDDGAVVYLNGQEVLRSNMSCGAINYQSTANTSIGGSTESMFNEYTIDGSSLVLGENVLAVEVHQNSASSSDLSFDLELIVWLPVNTSYISTSKDYSFIHTNDSRIVAVFEETGECILPSEITEDRTLYKDCSPYLAQGDVIIDKNVTLTIEPGVEIRMPENANIFVYGNIAASGTTEDRILFSLNPNAAGKSWGALCFIDSDTPSSLSYVTIENASKGPVPIRDVAAISAFNSDLVLDHLIIENVSHNPIAARYSNITLTNSILHSAVTGDLINVKYGHANISNCEFRGNDQSDVDAIDYDDIENGTISNCKIYNFFGFNSDAIDIGEKASHIAIDSLMVYNITDKGVSVGQQSSAIIQNCIFVNCNMGLGLKDSCHVQVNHCTFYGNSYPVACFEKNPGSAGGNVVVKNSILSNSYDQSYWADEKSTMQIFYTLADNDLPPVDPSNVFDNPLFTDPEDFNFQLQSTSPVLSAGDDAGTATHLGSYFQGFSGEPTLMFSRIFTNSQNYNDTPEFLSIYNPGVNDIDMAGYTITSGIEFEFPEGTTIESHQNFFLTKDISIVKSYQYPGQVLQWTSGKLANEGERIRLTDKYGIVLDQVEYTNVAPWPDKTNQVLSLIKPSLDNHFAESWEAIEYNEVINYSHDTLNGESLSIFPNPVSDILYIEASEYSNKIVEIYSITGKLIYTERLDESGNTSINLSNFESGILFIRIGETVKKVVFIHN